MPMFCMARGELKCYVVGQNVIDTQGFTPCHTTPNIFFWEEAKVNWQIQTLVNLGKMKLDYLKYACKVILTMKKMII